MSNAMPHPSDLVYWAHVHIKDGKPLYFHASPDRRWVEIHGLTAPIISIRLHEVETDAEASYWGWLKRRYGHYIFMWPSLTQVDMCFPGGVIDAEQRGDGRLVRLVATATADAVPGHE
jgi:hypothetical protein